MFSKNKRRDSPAGACCKKASLLLVRLSRGPRVVRACARAGCSPQAASGQHWVSRPLSVGLGDWGDSAHSDAGDGGDSARSVILPTERPGWPRRPIGQRKSPGSQALGGGKQVTGRLRTFTPRSEGGIPCGARLDDAEGPTSVYCLAIPFRAIYQSSTA